MGNSEKPDIKYTFNDHFDYLLNFIEKLELKSITLVVHDWGSGLGFHYANTHRGNIKGIAFMEALYRPMSWDQMPKGMDRVFKMLRTPFVGWLMISVANMFVKKMIPDMIVRKLTKEELEYYKSPYPTIASRKPVRVWPLEVPLDGEPIRTYETIAAYASWLAETEIPKICFYAQPGAIIREEDVQFIREHFSRTKMVDIGEGLHFIQEDNPHLIGQEIADWYRQILEARPVR